MNKTVMIEQTTGGFIVERCTHPESKTVHTDLPCALAVASDLLQPLELDKPELDPRHKEILQSMMDKEGCVTNVKDGWLWTTDNFHGVTTGRRNVIITAMLTLGLLDTIYPVGDSGMKLYAYVSYEGKEALKR